MSSTYNAGCCVDNSVVISLICRLRSTKSSESSALTEEHARTDLSSLLLTFVALNDIRRDRLVHLFSAKKPIESCNFKALDSFALEGRSA